MKRFVLLIFAFLLIIECLSQNIAGTVIDDAGNPIYDANVMIGGSKQSDYTNKDGKFSIKCKKGDVRIVISYEGLEQYDEKLTVGNEGLDIGTIVLQQAYSATDSLHVLEAISDKRTPMTFDTYNANYIESRNIVRDIPSILEHTPSFVALSENGSGIGFTNFRIRGMSRDAINVTINGIQLCDAESRQTLLHHLPDFATSISNISITRGAGSSSSGTYAYGASIDLTTETPSAKPYGDINIMGGSFNTIKASISAGTGLTKNGFSIDLRMSKLLSDGYIDMSASNHNAIMLSATWRGKTNSLNANIMYNKTKSGISSFGCPSQYLDINRRYNSAGEYYNSNGTKQYYNDTEENHQQTHVQLIYSQKIWNSIELNIKAFYNYSDGYNEEYKNKQNFSSYGMPNISLPIVVSHEGQIFTTTTVISQTDLIRRRAKTSNYYGGIVSATHSIGNFINTFGLTGKFYDGTHYGNLIWMQYAGNTDKDYKWYSNSSDKDEYSAFYKAEYTFIKKITLYADLQYRMINFEMRGTDCASSTNGSMRSLKEDLDFNFFNPKGGINYEINNKMRVYASVAHSHREPSRENINYANENGKEIESESLIDYELGYSYKSKIFSGELNLYYMDFHDQIVPTGEFSQDGYYIMTNVDRSYSTGVELAATVKPYRRITISANATFSRNKIENYTFNAHTYDNTLPEGSKEISISNTNSAFSPGIIAAGDIRYNIFGKFNIYYRVKYVGKQYLDNTSSNDRLIKAYCISSTGFDYEIVTKYVKGLRFKFEINNLFNAKYYDNAYGELWYENGVEKSLINYFPQAGINFMGGVTISF